MNLKVFAARQMLRVARYAPGAFLTTLAVGHSIALIGGEWRNLAGNFVKVWKERERYGMVNPLSRARVTRVPR